MSDRIAVIGLGYVGLPVALAFAKKFHTIGFDINSAKVQALKQCIDSTGEIDQDELKNSNLKITDNLEDLAAVNFFIVAVPTPIDCNHRPDLTFLTQASKTIGKVLKPGTVVVYESTVYPGVTEDICGKILAEVSGLRQSIDFKLGYSPERINPGDKSHTLEKIIKVVAGEDRDSLEIISRIYNTIIDAGIYQATSIKVAETAKVIENTQRDLNIALMNELALICDRLGIRTHDVLSAANTKWNFLPFTPGLVGGHCIGVAPYYLTTKAEELGYHPQVILAGRRSNDSMGSYIGQRLVKLLVQANLPIKGAKVGIFGLTFKENVPDLRNSRVPDIITELEQFGIEALVHHPIANSEEAEREYGIDSVSLSQLVNLDALIFTVNHQFYLDNLPKLISCLSLGGVLMDIKSAIEPDTIAARIIYWSL